MALQMELNRDPKKRSQPFTAAEIHPQGQQKSKAKDKETEVKRVPIRELKALFPSCQQTAQ